MTKDTIIRYLSRRDVESLALSPQSIADAIEMVLVASTQGKARNLPKSTIALADGGLYQATLAAGVDDPAPAYAAVKVLGLSPANEVRGLPHMGGVIVLLARATGLPVGILDAGWITDYRTAALTLIAARRLARPSASRIGFVACGAQARSHLVTLASEFPLRHVTAYSRRETTASAFADFARDLGFSVTVARAPADAVRDQDIVVTSVPAQQGSIAILEAGWLAPGAFAALVDLGRSWRADSFDTIEHRATDDRVQAEGASATRRLVPPGPYTADLAEIVGGGVRRQANDAERAVFVFQGLALGDLAAAALAFETAEACDIGILLAR